MISTLALWEPIEWLVNVATSLWENHQAEVTTALGGLAVGALALVILFDQDH